MVDLEWDPDNVPRTKLVLHTLQMLLVFTIWCLEIAVFVGKGAKIVADNAFTFTMCFVSIPAWLYLLMAPRFDRGRRFAEPRAMLVIDVLFTILWLAAFATQAAYNTANLCGQRCNLSKGIVGLGIFTTLLFAATSLISAYTLKYYNFHGTLPGYESRKALNANGSSSAIDPDKAAFSTADEDYERVNLDDREAAGANDYSDSGRYAPANPYSADDFADPSRYSPLPPRNNDLFNTDTEYSSGGAAHKPYADEPARFPAGNYDRAHP
ncbi:chaperone-binding protein [Ophiocordyceps camponoti-floridani]|uniref:Chaperone-binding protein n=1 Tax=Ophiocordyceps camponoti-floridani TaxID=2030778 RepID=A0A8H4VB26_9HYPO|nr:chaperone-binding protein [Ophiocordyceps camponoti-floridani]